MKAFDHDLIRIIVFDIFGCTESRAAVRQITASS